MARRKELEPEPQEPPSILDSADYVRPRTIQTDGGFNVPYVEADEAVEVLTRVLSGRTLSDDFWKLDGIDAMRGDDFGDRAQEIADLRITIVEKSLYEMLGPDFRERFHDEQRAAQIPQPTREQLAQEKAAGLAAQFHIACGQFKKKNGEPKKTLVARRMFELGFMLADIADVSGYSRGSLGDARQWLRSQYIREAKTLPPNLQLDPKRGRPRTGDDQRGGSGALFEQNREASRLVASVVDVLAPAPPKMSRRAYRNENEGIASAPINGTWDMGDYDDGEADE